MHKIDNLLSVQKIVTIHYQSLTKEYVSASEEHNFWEIIYSDKGDISVCLGEESVLLKAGEMVFIKPNLPHYVLSHNHEPNIFIVSFLCKSESMAYFNDRTVAVPDSMRYLLQNIMSEAKGTFHIPDFDPSLNELKRKENPNLGGEQIIKNSLELLLIYLLRRGTARPHSQEFFISKISESTDLQDEIVQFLTDKVYGTFKLQDLCNKLHYGKTYLCTFFLKKTGTSIYQTYLKLKIDEAKRLIRKRFSFPEIADKLRFDSVSHFNYAFKKATNMTPGEYKTSIR